MITCSKFLFVLLLYFNHYAIKNALCTGSCNYTTASSKDITGTIVSKKNSTGGWVTTFWAERDTKGGLPEIDELLMSVHHRYYECPGKKHMKIYGVITESTSEESSQYLRFHTRCGTNARVTNNGKSLEKIQIDKWDNGVAFTNRALKDNELFEVVIDTRGDQSTDAIGIGVTTHHPDNITIPNHMNNLESGTWLMYLDDVYKDGSSLKSSFMKNLKLLKVGERIGVKRTSSGNLHLYINGEDKGVAATNVSSPVYGVFELYYKILRVTIVDH